MNYYNVLIKLLDEQRQSCFDQTFLMSKCYNVLIKLFDEQLLSSFDQKLCFVLFFKLCIKFCQAH